MIGRTRNALGAKRRSWLPLLLLLGFSGAAAAADEQDPIESAITRLEIATAAHPDDPDLHWAYASALSRGGEADRAAERMQMYAARWPSRRQDLDLTLGRMLFEAGRTEEARARLHRAVRASPRSGTARFYHALALRALGRRIEARAELIRSGKLAPALLADSTLLLSIDAFAEGNEDEGVRLAQQVIQLDPTSDAAARARMLLRDKDLAATRRPWRADAYAGFDYDDNVTLAANKDDVAATDQDDIRGIWGVGLGWRQLVTDETQLMVGYRFDQAKYDALDDFDFLNNALFISALMKVHPRVALRLDLIGWNTRQSGDPYLWAGTARPSLLYVLPDRWGLLRAFANAEFRDFDPKPFVAAVEQDGWTFGGGLEWNVLLPRVDGTASLSASYHDTDTQAKSTDLDAGDFGGDYDARSLRVSSRLRLPLGWKVEAGGDLDYARNWYEHDNFIHFFTEVLTTAPGDIEIHKRRDHYVGGRVFLARPLHRFVTLEVEYKPSRRMSNVDLYDYERHMVGFVMRVQSN